MNKLRIFRMLQGMTQAQLARLSGVYFSSLSRIETGNIQPSRKQKAALSRALKKRVSEVFPDGKSKVPVTPDER